MSTRRRRLHIVVTCANRKRHPVPASLQLRRITDLQTTARLARWTRRLASSDIETVRANDLYAGEHWDIARALPTLGTGFARPTLWVASAGWGLIPVTAQIRPYSATFSPQHPDSVPDGAWGAQGWWNAVATWPGPTSGAPRTLRALVAEHPRDRILLVLSHRYFAACRADLADALTSAVNNSLISIIAAGVTPDPDIAAWQLPGNARLQQCLGGSLQSLNVRIAAYLLRAGLTDHEVMSRHLQHFLEQAPTQPLYTRRHLTDWEIINFIQTRRSLDATVSRTGLLRELRDADMACEQSRFANLFATVAGGRS